MASTIADKSLRDVLAVFASPTPTFGGGSACAATSAFGTSLLMMAASIAGLDHASLSRIEERLIDAIELDAVAYRYVIAAQRQPKDTHPERGLRMAAIHLALRGATEVPLSIMRLSASALYEATEIAARARQSTIGDIRVAVTLLRAALEGTRLTIDANLAALADAAYISAVKEECGSLTERATAAVADAERLLRAG